MVADNGCYFRSFKKSWKELSALKERKMCLSVWECAAALMWVERDCLTNLLWWIMKWNSLVTQWPRECHHKKRATRRQFVCVVKQVNVHFMIIVTVFNCPWLANLIIAHILMVPLSSLPHGVHFLKRAEAFIPQDCYVFKFKFFALLCCTVSAIVNGLFKDV